MQEPNISTMQDYNEEPVFYCAHCLSLAVRHISCIEGSEYCDSCGSTYIKTASIFEWEKLYKDKYGHKFLEKR